MSRPERWSTRKECMRRFPQTRTPGRGAGPIVYTENGKCHTDDSENHILVIGRTGKGKSQCCSKPFARECVENGESLILADPKGEIRHAISCYIPENYQQFCIDLRNPRTSPDKWNPVLAAYQLFRSEDPDDHDVASSMVSELWSSVYPWDGHSDRFWVDASANYAKGLTYGLFETAPAHQVNLDSVARMMQDSEVRFGAGSVLKSFYDSLPDDSLAKRNLATYATAPNETRASIHSVASSGLEVFSRSRGLMEMLAGDSLDILKLDVTRPFVLTIITPDETDAYDSLAGLLVSQVTQHLIRVAQDMGGKLPIRVNVILEELGSIGKSIKALPNLAVASRSRNIRLMMVLQSYAQLHDVYGKSKAETIISSVGLTFGFSTNAWDTLNEWSQMCGNRSGMANGHSVTEPLITAAQLAAMPTGTCLVMVDNRYKFISKLPFYSELYDASHWTPPAVGKPVEKSQLTGFNFLEFVKESKRQQLLAALPSHQAATKEDPLERLEEPVIRPFNRPPLPLPVFDADEEEETGGKLDLEALMRDIDRRIAQLDAEEAERAKGDSFCVEVTGGDRIALAKVIRRNTSLALGLIIQKLRNMPARFYFPTKQKAEKLAEEIRKNDGQAKVIANVTQEDDDDWS